MTTSSANLPRNGKKAKSASSYTLIGTFSLRESVLEKNAFILTTQRFCRWCNIFSRRALPVNPLYRFSQTFQHTFFVKRLIESATVLCARRLKELFRELIRQMLM